MEPTLTRLGASAVRLWRQVAASGCFSRSAERPKMPKFAGKKHTREVMREGANSFSNFGNKTDRLTARRRTMHLRRTVEPLARIYE